MMQKFDDMLLFLPVTTKASSEGYVNKKSPVEKQNIVSQIILLN